MSLDSMHTSPFSPEPHEDNAFVGWDNRNLEEMRKLKAQLHHQLVSAMDLTALGTMERTDFPDPVDRFRARLVVP